MHLSLRNLARRLLPLCAVWLAACGSDALPATHTDSAATADAPKPDTTAADAAGADLAADAPAEVSPTPASPDPLAADPTFDTQYAPLADEAVTTLLEV